MDFSREARLARFQEVAKRQEPFTVYRHSRASYQAVPRRPRQRPFNNKRTIVDGLIVLAFVLTTALILFVGTGSTSGVWL